MPVHAASSTSTSVSDFFISSYTPTLDALLSARARPVPATTKVLAAIQPSPGKGWSSLPNTKAELKAVREIVPPEHLLSLSPTGGDDDANGELEGLYTTSSAILSRFHDASVFHLACHGDQLPSNPLQSGFIMKDGERLTVEMLMRVGADTGTGGVAGGVALLSACHTAANDSERPDESINLAAVMLFVGFRSVLATMWCVKQCYCGVVFNFVRAMADPFLRPMGDPDGPVITRAIYKTLFGEAEKDLRRFCLARALDDVVRHLKKTIPSERWATFIHIGA